MKTVITKGLDGKKKEEIQQDFLSSVAIRARIVEILKEKVETSRTASTSKEAYANASWPYLQADSVGYERALKEVISILE